MRSITLSNKKPHITRTRILDRELDPSGDTPNQRSRWKLAFSLLKHIFNLCICNAATIRYSLFKFGYVHLGGKGYNYFSPHCCKCNSFGCIAAIKCGNACHGPHIDSVYSGSEHCQFNSPRLVKREAGFPNPRLALIGSNQLWRVNDPPYYREYCLFDKCKCTTVEVKWFEALWRSGVVISVDRHPWMHVWRRHGDTLSVSHRISVVRPTYR